MKSISSSILLAALATGAMVGADLLSAQSAQALSFDYDANTITLDSTSLNTPFTVFFYGGLIGANNASDPLKTQDLQAEAILTLTDFSSDAAQFNIIVNNNSGGGITDSRISIFGFDVSTPSGQGTFDFAGSNGDGTVKASGQTPGIFPGGSLDICFKGGGNANNCTAGGGGGVLQGNSFSFSPTLAFNAPGVTSFTLSNFYVRYQGIEGVVDGITLGDASGVGNPGVVPTPALLPGLLGLGVAALRKKQGDAAEEA
ncbi:cistern family PEP-CTERM protein [Nodosilinea sp. AN01ver1]|uniref:cistern family PEP-CTERM protein n=1 Tax=Nodosilinea sp. AN01ver1 TaxID=3423362 RepID=UPI003D30F6CD